MDQLSGGEPGIRGRSAFPYRIESQIGAGGMGEVYRAYDHRVERWVAVKKLRPEVARNARAWERFKREARVIASLSHRSIVRIHNIVESAEGDWIVMELVEGKTLRRLVAGGELDLVQALHLGREIAEGLAAAHARGVVHRDLKTENVMVTTDGHAKILDFGIAKRLWQEHGDSSLTAEGVVLGTYRAMSPEQAMARRLDARSDLFSLGTLLFEALTGQYPFLGSSPMDTLVRVVHFRQPGVRMVNPRIPVEVSRLVDRLLEKLPQDRPRSAAKVAAELGRILQTVVADRGSVRIPLPPARDVRPDTPMPGSEDLTLRLVRDAARRKGRRGPPAPTTVVDRFLRKDQAGPPQRTAKVTRDRIDGPLEAKRERPWTRSRTIVLGFPVLVLLVVTSTLLRFRTQLPLSGVAREVRPSVAVLGFKNLSESEESGWLSTALAEIISTELAAGEDLRLISGENVARMKIETDLADTDTLALDTLAMIRENLDTDYVIIGSYLSLEQEAQMRQIGLQVRLQDTRSGETWSTSEQGDEKDLFNLVLRIGSGVRHKLNVEEITSDEAAAVRATLSASPEAVRLYFEGLERLRSFEALTARDLFQEAIGIDRDWALAHAGLGQAWLALGYDREAEQSAGRAFVLADNLPREEQLWIQGRYYEAAGQWQAAIRTIQSLWGFFPDNVEYGLRLAELQTRAGQAKEALATVATLRELLGSAATDPRIDLAEAAANHSLNEFKLAIAAAQAAVKKATASEAWILAAEGWRLQGQAHYELHKTEDAQTNLRAAGRYLEQAKSRFEQAGDRGKVAEVLYLMAIKAMDEDNLTGADDLFRQALEVHTETGSKQRLADELDALSYNMILRGELLLARPIVDQAVDAARATRLQDRVAFALDSKAFLLYRLGDLAGAEETSREALTIADEIRDWLKSGFCHYSLGRTALASGDVAGARFHFDDALEIGGEIGHKMLRSYALRGLGEVLLTQGDLAGALRKIEESQAADKPTSPETQMAHARLLLELGQPAQAEALARKAASNFSKAGESDNEAGAGALAAEALLAQHNVAAARKALAPAKDHAYRGQVPAVRHQVAIADARLLAAENQCGEALGLLETSLAEATQLGLVAIQLEISLVLGKIEIDCDGLDTAAAGPGSAGRGRARLSALAAEAEEKGFLLIARKAASRADLRQQN